MEVKSRSVQSRPSAQAGVALLEAMIAILVFSLGVLALVGLQATSMRLSGESKYRATASAIVNELIAEMWMSRQPISSLKTDYETNGPKYKAWLKRYVGDPDDPTTVNFKYGLGGVIDLTARPPIVVIDADGLVTITLFWRDRRPVASTPPYSSTPPYPGAPPPPPPTPTTPTIRQQVTVTNVTGNTP